MSSEDSIKATMELVATQKKHTLLEVLGSIPHFNGEGSSTLFTEFKEQLDSFSKLLNWDEEESKFVLLAKLGGPALKLAKLHKAKTFKEIVDILTDRYVSRDTPAVVLSKFMAFKQESGMGVREFYEKASEMSANALIVDGVQPDIVENSRKAMLHNMLLSNLAPEIRKGVIVKDPSTPEDILKYALLEEKAFKSVSPFYLPTQTTPHFSPQGACGTTQFVGATGYQPKVAESKQPSEIDILKEKFDLLSAKLDSLIESKQTQRESQNSSYRGNFRSENSGIVCYLCSGLNHYARDCRNVNRRGRGSNRRGNGRGNYNNYDRRDNQRETRNYDRQNGDAQQRQESNQGGTANQGVRNNNGNVNNASGSGAGSNLN